MDETILTLLEEQQAIWSRADGGRLSLDDHQRLIALRAELSAAWDQRRQQRAGQDAQLRRADTQRRAR